MIDGLRPFPQNKPSAVPWLGDVPAHWGVLRSKYAFQEVDSRSATGDETHLSMSQRLGLVPANQVERSLVSESYVGAKLVMEGDLVLNRLKAHLGVFAYAKQPGLISPDYTVLRPMTCANVRFFEYVLKSPACRAELRTRAKGIVEGFWRLYTDDFYDIRLPVPPLDEQRLIVRFLDWHGAQTAKLIRAKKKVIALLNEQKRAIIHRAVTRGLDPNVRFKPSGIPWLGDVPEGWEGKRLVDTTVAVVNGVWGSDPDGAHDIICVRVADFDRRNSLVRLDAPTWRSVPEKERSRRLLEPGDLLIEKSGGGDQQPVGAVVLYNHDAPAICSNFVARVKISPLCDPTYVTYLHNALYSISLNVRSIKQTTGIQNLNGRSYFSEPVFIPPLYEQQEISDYLAQKLQRLEASIDLIARELSLIQEFRTRLIADVVTGKLDVRAVAARLPDTTDVESIDNLVEDDGLDEAVDEAEGEEVAA